MAQNRSLCLFFFRFWEHDRFALDLKIRPAKNIARFAVLMSFAFLLTCPKHNALFYTKKKHSFELNYEKFLCQLYFLDIQDLVKLLQ